MTERSSATDEIDRLRAALKDAEDRADLYANSRPVVEAATPPCSAGISDGWRDIAAGYEKRLTETLAERNHARNNALSALAGLFSESVHETWTKSEIVNIIEDAIRLGSPISSKNQEIGK